MPIFLAPARSLPAKAGCMSTSPPDSVGVVEFRRRPATQLGHRAQAGEDLHGGGDDGAHDPDETQKRMCVVQKA